MTKQQREYIDLLYKDGWKPKKSGDEGSPICGMGFQSMWIPVSKEQYDYALFLGKEEVVQ